jgi:V8-like Glu-specific endopeptidase
VNDTRSDVSLVLTAAHCAYDQANNSFATNWMFIPDFDAAPSYSCGATVYGCWTAQALVVDSGFATAGGFNAQATRHDYAFAVVGAGGDNLAQLDGTVGSFAIQFSGVSSRNTLYAFGYPAAGKYQGSDLTYCAGKIGTDPYNSGNTWSMACDMTGGSSGGPWLASFNENTGVGILSSLNSYGYSGIRNMYGPKFNDNTQATFTSADATTTNAIVPVAP